MTEPRFKFVPLSGLPVPTPKKKTRLGRAISAWRKAGREPSTVALALALVPESETEVPVLGEELAPVLWQGEQWAVTEYGIEARDGRYQLEAALLNDLAGGYTLMHHMASKGWVDMRDFGMAFAIACAVFEVRFDKGVQ